MFYWDEKCVSELDLRKASAFVKFWSRFHKDDVKIIGTGERINYIEELAIGSLLSEENVRRLLRWKDRRHLTDPIQSGDSAGFPNPFVANVLSRLDAINAFRQGEVTYDCFKRTTEEVFTTGVVWRAFLCHVARPSEYPILDRYVLLAFTTHTGQIDRQNWDTYEAYMHYFHEVAQNCGVGTSSKVRTYVEQLKIVDNALLAFGQFLQEYGQLHRPSDG